MSYILRFEAARAARPKRGTTKNVIQWYRFSTAPDCPILPPSRSKRGRTQNVIHPAAGLEIFSKSARSSLSDDVAEDLRDPVAPRRQHRACDPSAMLSRRRRVAMGGR